MTIFSVSIEDIWNLNPPIPSIDVKKIRKLRCSVFNWTPFIVMSGLSHNQLVSLYMEQIGLSQGYVWGVQVIT